MPLLPHLWCLLSVSSVHHCTFNFWIVLSVQIVHTQNIMYWDQMNGTWNTHSFLHSSCIAQIPPFLFPLSNFLYCVSNLNRSLFFIAFSSFFPFSSNPVSLSSSSGSISRRQRSNRPSHSCFVVVWADSFLASPGQCLCPAIPYVCLCWAEWCLWIYEYKDDASNVQCISLQMGRDLKQTPRTYLYQWGRG